MTTAQFRTAVSLRLAMWLRLAAFGLLASMTAVAAAEETAAGPESAKDRVALVVVVGVAGEPEFAPRFAEWADRWRTAGEAAGAAVTLLRPEDATDEMATRRQLAEAIERIGVQRPSSLWVVLIGHGTFDGKTARFNAAGPDIAAAELSQWLRPVECPVAVINCTAMSSPFVNALSAPNRVVVTATRTGQQENVTRLGDFLSETVRTGRGDFDKDGSVSLLEMAVDAAARTAASYEDETRVASENALIDDNADGRGTRLDWFDGVRLRADKSDKSDRIDNTLSRELVLAPGPEAATLSESQRGRRRELERRLERLRGARPERPDADYFEQLEAILVPLARLYAESDAESDASDKDGDAPQPDAPAAKSTDAD